ILNAQDNCPRRYNPDQKISFPGTFGPGTAAGGALGLGDACNNDIDGDGCPNATDNCPLFPNAGSCNKATNPNPPSNLPAGVVCSVDTDKDGIDDSVDNCPLVYNPDQADINHNGIGDACDSFYCVVTDPTDKAACLDPNSAFSVSAGGHMSLNNGEKVRLPLFANRK